MSSIQEIKNKENEIKKLAICVPMRGKVDVIFMQSYLALFIHLLKKRGIVAQPVFSDAMPLDKARNQLAKSAILNKSDYALWLDSDMVMTEAHFEKAWNTLHKLDDEGKERFIVSGIYYEREIPYDAVIRNKNELGLYSKIMDFPDDKPFKIDGMGFGFVLMKSQPLKDAFAATQGKPFQWTEKVSEDLHFCDLMSGNSELTNIRMVDKDKNPITYDIWCDPEIQIPHYGSYTTQWHHLHYKLDEYADTSELARYLKIQSEECYTKCVNGALAMCKEWQSVFGKNRDDSTIPEAEVLKFYRNTKGYLYDLTWFWSHSRQTRDMVVKRWVKDAPRVLDFGCGLGDYGLMYLADYPKTKMDFYDINIANLDYLKYRIDKKSEKGHFQKENCTVYEGELPPNEDKYDMIFALDVLEHLKNPSVEVAKIRKMLKRNGTLIAQVSPKGAFQPQHISEIDISLHGFIQTDLYTYVRDDSDMAVSYAANVKRIKDNMVVNPMKR